MKRIKSNHLWRRGATLLLAMLMLFTCVGSALPAFAEEAAGNTATVDSGDPVLADSSASGDSTGDTGTDLPDDPQRPTLPSGEDISEEAPPADESDGETVPPADSDSSEDPAAPDSGDSIPDESESEPAEQPGEGDADLPEDEQPSGEEPDPDEDEEIPENEPEDEPFEALVILDPENGAAVQAGVGEEVTFKAPVSREDVAVAYQWQRFQKPAAGSVQTEALYDYAEGETTEYWYALDDMREAEALAMNPDMLCLTAVCSVPERCGKAHPGSVCRQKRKSRRRFLYPRAARNGRRDAGDLCGFGLGNPVHDLAVCQRRKASESVPGADGVCAWQLAVHPALCRVDFRVSSVLSGNSV